MTDMTVAGGLSILVPDGRERYFLGLGDAIRGSGVEQSFSGRAKAWRSTA